jgi:hypothetical protein
MLDTFLRIGHVHRFYTKLGKIIVCWISLEILTKYSLSYLKHISFYFMINIELIKLREE